MRGFNYGGVTALNLRWMRYPKESTARYTIGLVEALQERDSTIGNIEISDGSSKIAVPVAIKTGDYAEYWGDGTIHVFDQNGTLLRTVPVQPGPQLREGENRLAVKANRPANIVFTAITVGK
jgi:hypothetical protein